MTPRTVTVRMSEMETVRSTPAQPVFLKTTLGSCVGIILSHERSGLHGLAHIMLPERIRKDPAVGKFADTAIPELVGSMERQGAARGQLKGFLVGGANMFELPGRQEDGDGNGMFLIGRKNVEASKRMLESLNITVVFEDTGGNRGRTVIFFGNPDGNSGSPVEAQIEIRTLEKIAPITGGKRPLPGGKTPLEGGKTTTAAPGRELSGKAAV